VISLIALGLTFRLREDEKSSRLYGRLAARP